MYRVNGVRVDAYIIIIIGRPGVSKVFLFDPGEKLHEICCLYTLAGNVAVSALCQVRRDEKILRLRRFSEGRIIAFFMKSPN